MCVHLQQPERSEIFIFSGLYIAVASIKQWKTNKVENILTADNLIVFAGEFFTEEIEDTESRMFRHTSSEVTVYNTSNN